ncbi:MAG: dual specificity protein phosphatase family protein [Anaerolineae bacterium]|nr:dual specificity protein phosphatase family protein [Anaerolineae bacterium]
MDISWIEPNILAASPLPSSEADIRSLHAQGIRAIITLTERPITTQAGVTPELLSELDITPLHVSIDDFGAPDNQQVVDAMHFIEQMQASNKPVLVHCKVGQGRTGTLLHAYYLNKGWSLNDAREQVWAKRPLCDFNNLSQEQQTFLREFATTGRTVYI